jgi:hypothetical protein
MDIYHNILVINIKILKKLSKSHPDIFYLIPLIILLKSVKFNHANRFCYNQGKDYPFFGKINPNHNKSKLQR